MGYGTNFVSSKNRQCFSDTAFIRYDGYSITYRIQLSIQATGKRLYPGTVYGNMVHLVGCVYIWLFMIKAVLFDFDGTLANTLPYYIKAYDHALHAIGKKLSKKDIAQKCFGKKEEEICKTLGVPQKINEFAHAYFFAVKNLFKQARLFKDTLPILKFLKKKKIKIIIITFAYRWFIDKMMEQYDLQKYIDFIISTDDVVNTKPHPEAVLKTVEKLKIKPQETIVVGNSQNDILMGKSAGSVTVLFTRKEYDVFYSFDELQKTKPSYITDSIQMIKQFVKEK